MVGALKRGHPTTDDDSTANSHSVRVPHDSMKARSKPSDPDTSVKGISNHSATQCTNKVAPKGDKSISDNAVSVKRLKYNAFSRSLYVVMLRSKSDNTSSKKRMSLVKISGILNKCNIKFNQVVKYSRDTWKVTFLSKSVANSALTNKLLEEAGIVTFIPRFKISRKVVIKEIPKDMSLDEVKKIVEEENSNVVISNLFRSIRRNRSTREFEDSEAVCLEIRGESLRDKIIIWKAVLPVSPYVQSVRIYFKCGHTGYISKYCEEPEACLNCAGDHRSSREAPCGLEKKCINCSGPHNTTDRNCPVLKKHMEIAKVMAFDNLSFLEARSLVERNINSSRVVPVKSLRNFSRLPDMDSTAYETQRSYPELLNDFPWYKSVLSSSNNEGVKKVLSDIIERVLTDKDAEVLRE
ncbi:hypothetical protein ALC57_04384 [Trachymyrmex cornetzi]|uniref:Nucleic-acid-binding protein from mobile element jockey n=1 Tax=Trachymyrmex cornetzi TaxID=471704 RepID=A0A151JCR5_9HYME|nr:hypothetical protein ALC57_04384 [Trachymyrmex cornetzi]